MYDGTMTGIHSVVDATTHKMNGWYPVITHTEQKQTQSEKGLVRSVYFNLLDRYEKNSHRFIKKETLVYSYSNWMHNFFFVRCNLMREHLNLLKFTDISTKWTSFSDNIESINEWTVMILEKGNGRNNCKTNRTKLIDEITFH